MSKFKFSDAEISTKKLIRQARLDKGMSMRAGSKAMGRTVKNLEDIETVQPYGCHITLDILLATSNAYGWTLAELVEWESPEGGTE